MSIVRLFLVIMAVATPLLASAEQADDLIALPQLRKAIEDLKANKTSEALARISGMNPNTGELAEYNYVAGRIKIAEKKPLEALEHYRKAYIYAPKGGLKEQILAERADLYFSIGYFYEARSVYSIFIKTFPESRQLGRVYGRYARCLAETGSLKESLPYFEKAGTAPDIQIAKANTLHRLGQYREADAAYASVPDSAAPLISASDETLFYIGENSRQLGKNEEAAGYLKKISSAKFREKAAVSLGIIELQKGRTDEARKLLDAVLKSEDRDARRLALMHIADADIKAGRKEDARKSLEEIRTRYPYGKMYDEAMMRLARIQREEGELEKSVQLLTGLAVKAQYRKEALDSLEGILRDAGKKDSARFISLWKTAGPLLLDASREKFLLDSADNLRLSEKDLVSVMQYLGRHGSEAAKARGASELASYYFSKGDTAKAEENIKRLRAMKSAGEEVIRLEAAISLLKKDYKAASDSMLRLKKLQSKDERLLRELVDAADIPAVVSRYEKLLRESGGDEKAYVRLGDIMYNRGKLQDAISYYRLALKKNAGNDWSLYMISILTDGQEAEDAVKGITSQDPRISRLAEARMKELELAKKGIEATR